MNIKWHDRKKECMKVRERDGVTVLTWPELEKLTDYAHCFTTRLGGVSTGIYSSMNLSFTRGDRDEDVRENFRRISHVLGFEPEDIVASDQTHTTNVRRISGEDRGCGVTKPRRFMDVDGLVTNVPGILLATFYADCVPLYFVDPEKKSHRSFTFRLERNGRTYGCCDCENDEERIRNESGRPLCRCRTIHLSGVL